MITPFCEYVNLVYNATYEECIPVCDNGYYYEYETDDCQQVSIVDPPHTDDGKTNTTNGNDTNTIDSNNNIDNSTNTNGNNSTNPEEPVIKCNDIAHDNESVCSTHGQCLEVDNCDCNGGYSGDNCEIVDKLTTPTGVTIKNVTSDSFIFSWNAVNLATSYVVVVSAGSSKSEKTTSETSISSLAQSIKYTVTVKAQSLISESDVATVRPG